MLEKIKNNKILLLIIILLLIVITLITKKIATKQELIMDKIAYDILVTRLRTPILTSIMKLATKLSNITFIAISSILLVIYFLFIKKEKKQAELIIGNLAFITLLNQIIKFMIRRERPTGFRLIEMT